MKVASLLLRNYLLVIYFGDSQPAACRCTKLMLLVALKRLVAIGVNPRYKEDCLEYLILRGVNIASRDSIVTSVLFDCCVVNGIPPADHHFILPVEER